MSKEINFRVTNPNIPKFKELIDRVNNSMGDQKNEGIIKDILNARDYYKEFGLKSDDLIVFCDENIKERLLAEYVKFMGICFYYYESGNQEYAWFYYAEANYYRGAENYWDHAFYKYTNEDLKRYERAKKGKAQVKKQDDKLLDILIKICSDEKYRNKAGWRNKKEFIDIALEEIYPIFEKLNFDKKLLPENLDKKIRFLLDNCTSLSEAYEKNKFENNS